VTESGVTQSYILFTVADTTYALPSHQVQHVEMIEQVTPVPNAPPFVEGVVFSRGQVVPVLNLRVRFGFDRTARGLSARLLVVDAGGRLMGLLADGAREFVTIPDDAIQPPSAAIAGLSGSYIDGVATMGDRIVLVLNLNQVIDAVPTIAA
jgi:chemotaxis signal transduction protein